jgi:hypothetical protein
MLNDLANFYTEWIRWTNNTYIRWTNNTHVANIIKWNRKP